MTPFDLIGYRTYPENYESYGFVVDIKAVLENLESRSRNDLGKDFHKRDAVYLVVDRASFHKSRIVLEYIATARCELYSPETKKTTVKLFLLPPFTPDLNPTESYNHHLKSTLGKMIHSLYPKVKPTSQEFDRMVLTVLRNDMCPVNGYFRYFRHTMEYAQALILNEGKLHEIGKLHRAIHNHHLDYPVRRKVNTITLLANVETRSQARTKLAKQQILDV
jgi:hypothetical protein